MDVIDNQGRVVGRIVKAGITQVSQGRKSRRVECVAQLLLPGCQTDYRRFPDIHEARAWIVAGAKACRP